jgi:hypothetical protein
MGRRLHTTFVYAATDEAWKEYETTDSPPYSSPLFYHPAPRLPTPSLGARMARQELVQAHYEQ